MSCKYCEGDIDGWFSNLPKKEPCKGSAVVCESREDACLVISLPYQNRLSYSINYCPMCGRKLAERKKVE